MLFQSIIPTVQLKKKLINYIKLWINDIKLFKKDYK